MENTMKTHGFTLIELLIVIAIIGILAAIVISNLFPTTDKAKTARAQEELHSLQLAIQNLIDDTGKLPNGCDPNGGGNPEVALNGAQAGLTSRPTQGSTGSGCIWTADEVANWNGPYIPANDNLVDPWGSPYYFDPDYHPGKDGGAWDCSFGDQATDPIISVVESFGPDKTGVNSYDCDDIYLQL